MSSCLGVYIQKNYIKYARLDTDKFENIKLQGYGVKFYKSLDEVIPQIITETASFNVPVSFAVSNEIYNYFEIFNKLKKVDSKNFLNLEFESFCQENNLKESNFENRYTIIENKEAELNKVLHISAPKEEIGKINNIGKKNRLNISNISVLPVSIVNLKRGRRTNEQTINSYAVLNIEEKSTLTVVNNGSIEKVIYYPLGIDHILDRLNYKINSYMESYEICRNYEMYSKNNTELLDSRVEVGVTTDYTLDINPTIDDLMQRMYNDLVEYKNMGIKKLFISGTGTIFKNIDLYIQEYTGFECEVLSPYFIDKQSTNLKGYLETTSAIALAYDGLKSSNNLMNFHKRGISDLLKNSPIDFSVIFKDSKKSNAQATESNGDNKLKGLFENVIDANNSPEFNIWLLRFIIIFIMFISIYSYNVTVINSRVIKKLSKVDVHIAQQNTELNKITEDTNYIQEQIGQIDKYEQDIIKSKSDLVAQQSTPKGTYEINTILNEIMFIIPENTEITKLVTKQKNITMDIQSKDYSQIGFFIATLRNQNLLKNIQITNPEFKDVTKLTITGDLP